MSSHMSISSPVIGDHPLLRINTSSSTVSDSQSGSQGVRFESFGDGVGNVVSATSDDDKETPTFNQRSY